MHRALLVSRPLAPLSLSALIALLIGAHAATAASVSTRILIDPMGENDGDQFGSSLASAGDVNGDGYDDLVIGAHFYPTLSGQGRAYLYFGGPSIDVTPDVIIPAPSTADRWFGTSVNSAGDFNGDGWTDVIVGARNAGLPGKAFIYYGGPALDAIPDLVLIGETTGSMTWFGNSVAPAGDVNGDGFDDVIVGAPAYGANSTQVGRVYVFYGGNSPDAIPDRVLTGPVAGDQLGWVVGAGDMNGDGHPDLFATAPRYYSSGTDLGEVYVWFGGPTFDTVADLTIHGSESGQHIRCAAIAGDINSDGFGDLIVGEGGNARVYFGGVNPNASSDLTLSGNFASISGVGDVNADGAADFVLGDSSDDTGGADAGRVSVFYGGSALDTQADLSFVGDRPGRQLGLGVVGAGNVDGSGPADVAAAATEDPEGIGYDSGRVYVYANEFTPTAVPATPARGIAFMGPRPNPAAGDVGLELALDHAVPVRLTVYDLTGHEVARPIADEMMNGHIIRRWRPQGLRSGVYYLSAKLGAREQVRKLVWLGEGH